MTKRHDKISLTLGSDLIAELNRRADAMTCSVSLLVRQYCAAGMAQENSNTLREISPTWGKAHAGVSPAAPGAKRRPQISGGGEMSA